MQQLAGGDSWPVRGAARVQPVRAFGDVEAADSHQQSGHDSGGEHPAPGDRDSAQRPDTAANAGAAQGADCLEGKRAQHQFTAAGAGDAFGDDHVCGWIVAAQRQPKPEQADHQREEVIAKDSSARKAVKMIISTMNIDLRPK